MWKHLWHRDTVTPYLGQFLQLSQDMLRKRPKNRNHYKNNHSIFTSECKQLLPKIYSSCIYVNQRSSNGSLHSLLNPGQPKCITNISTIEGLAFRPWKKRGNWRPSGQFHSQTPRGSFRGFTAYPRPQTTIIIIIIKLQTPGIAWLSDVNVPFSLSIAPILCAFYVKKKKHG